MKWQRYLSKKVIVMYDPCKICYLYPRDCPALCTSKMAYINEFDEDTPFTRRLTKKSNVFYENGKRFELNKNGIRREVR